MFVDPSAGEDVGVAYGGNSGCLVVKIAFAATIGPTVLTLVSDGHNSGWLKAFDAVGWDAVEDDEEGLVTPCQELLGLQQSEQG